MLCIKPYMVLYRQNSGGNYRFMHYTLYMTS